MKNANDSMGNRTERSGEAADRSMGDLSTQRAEAQRKRFRTGDVLMGRYRITGELGQGGMGVVFRCFDEIGGVDVSLKALPPELSHNSVEMEEVRENFQLVQGLHHPNIAAVKTLERDVDSGDCYLVMECVEGVNLRRWRKDGREGRRTAAEIVPVLRQMAAALDFAHSRRIVHRDIKPSNVMLQADGTVKVLDFGLAAQIHTSMSRVSRAEHGTSGTGPYMAPEQWRGERQDEKTDLYALGVLTYELLAGRCPFENPDPGVLRTVVLNEAPKPIPGVAPRAWTTLKCALAKEPAQRYSSCALFVEALRTGERPAGADRKPRGGRFAVIAAAAIAVAAMGLWAWQRSQVRRPVPPAPANPVEVQPVAPSRSTQPQPPPKVEPEVKSPAPAAAGATQVRLNVRPSGAALVIVQDGRLIRELPALAAKDASVELAAGRYTFTASKPGYRVLNEVVDVATNTVPWERTLVELTGQLVVQSTPGADVSAVNETGETRVVGRVNAAGEIKADLLLEGRYRLRIAHKDYEPAELADVEIVDGKPATVKRPLVGLPGRLRVASSKPAEIWEGGRRIGKTDETIAGVAAGAHTLEIRRKGFRTERLTVDMPANGFANLTAPTLTPEAGGVRVTATVPAYAQAHFAKTARRVKIGANPWKVVAALPCLEEGLACEPTEVAFEAEGYSGAAGARRVNVEDGKIAEARFDLEPVPARLTVACEAPGAEVFDANGGKLGAAGVALSVPSLQDVRLRVAAARHEPQEVRLGPMEPGKAFRSAVALKEQPGPVEGQSWTSPATGMEFVWVGALKMWVGKYEATNGEYLKKEPGHDSKEYRSLSLNGDRQPVVYVNFDDAKAYAEWMTQRDRAASVLPAGMRYRLPSEQEWQTFAQCGDRREYPWGNSMPPKYGNYCGQEAGGIVGDMITGYSDGSVVTCEVERSGKNDWGLYGVGGNVWEVAADDVSGGSFGAWRGASWILSYPDTLRCVYRLGNAAAYRGISDGFRLVLSAR